MGHPDLRIRTLSQSLLKLVYEHVCTSLFKVGPVQCSISTALDGASLKCCRVSGLCLLVTDMQCTVYVDIVTGVGVAGVHSMPLFVVTPLAILCSMHVLVYNMYMIKSLSNDLRILKNRLGWRSHDNC